MSGDTIEKLEANQSTPPPGTPEAFLAPNSMPDTPLVRPRPSPRRASPNPRDLWASCELLSFLTWRDLKVRYKQTLPGAGWAVIQPLLTVLALTLTFGRTLGVPSDGMPYLIFGHAGLLRPYRLDRVGMIERGDE